MVGLACPHLPACQRSVGDRLGRPTGREAGAALLVGRASAVMGRTACGPTAFAVGRPFVLIGGKLLVGNRGSESHTYT